MLLFKTFGRYLTQRFLRAILSVFGTFFFLIATLDFVELMRRAGDSPTATTPSSGATATVARRFDRVAWPAFGLLILTGIWNLAEIDVTDTSTEYQVTLAVKLLAVAASGIGAAVHRGAKTTLVLAVAGAIGAIGALAALFLGVVLHG